MEDYAFRRQALKELWDNDVERQGKTVIGEVGYSQAEASSEQGRRM